MLNINRELIRYWYRNRRNGSEIVKWVYTFHAVCHTVIMRIRGMRQNRVWDVGSLVFKDC